MFPGNGGDLQPINVKYNLKDRDLPVNLWCRAFPAGNKILHRKVNSLQEFVLRSLLTPLRPAVLTRQRADAGSVDAYPPPAQRVSDLRQGSHERLRRLALRVPVLVVDASAAALKRPRRPTARLVKKLFDVLSGTGFEFGQDGDDVPPGVHRLGFIRHPLALAVTHRVLPAVAPVLSVALLSRLVGRSPAAQLPAHEVIGEVERRRLQRRPVAEQHPR